VLSEEHVKMGLRGSRNLDSFDFCLLCFGFVGTLNLIMLLMKRCYVEMFELIEMMVKVSSLSVKEWEDLLDRILKKLGYNSVSKLENENKMILIADRGSDGKCVRICVQKMRESRLGAVSLPKVKVVISDLSREEEDLFNEMFMRSKGGC